MLKLKHFHIQEKLPCFSHLLTEKMSLDIAEQEIETEKLKLDALVEQEMKSSELKFVSAVSAGGSVKFLLVV